MSILEAVARYKAEGWAVVPLEPGSKGLADKGWLKKAMRHGYDIADFKPTSNVGVVPGPASRDRVNFDLDSEIAVRVGAKILPDTGLIHGRPGKPRSHYHYVVPGVRPRKYLDPVTNTMLLEVQAGTRCDSTVRAWITVPCDQVLTRRDLADFATFVCRAYGFLLNLSLAIRAARP